MSPKKKLFKNLVVIDSNFILLPFQFKIDFFNDINSSLEGGTKFILFKQIFDELEAKKTREPNSIKFQKQLKSGLLYLEKSKKKYDIIFKDDVKEKEETTDDFLLLKAIELKKEGVNVFLATNDQPFRRKLREALIGAIFLRQQKYLSIERS